MATTSPSIKLIRASDGSGNASAATVQNTRSPGATTIQVDTVQGIPDNFYASMGTPHTFTDPVTGETITVISEASAVDFEGHVDGSNLEIDAIAAGYTDGGSAVGDIVIIRPITSYANNIADVLDVAHTDAGYLKSGAADRALNAPQGFLINGKIERTVSSNNLTVAIKTLAGATPSASDPVYVRIGDTIRSVTAALSLTLNAGTNWFGAGASFFAAAEGDWFVYLIWNSNTSTVVLGVAKEPDMNFFSDRSATNTDYGHLAITGTAPAATDRVEVVGRFNAILGASASYNWSLPATALVINRPIFETREFSYTNNGSAGGTMYFRQSGYVKELYGSTGNVGSGTAYVNFPTGFFSAIKAIAANATGGYNNTNVVYGHIETHGLTQMGVSNFATAGSAQSNPVNVNVKGT